MDELYRAIADPTRRAILDELVDRDGQSLFELCGRLTMKHGISSSRQAISQHLFGFVVEKQVAELVEGYLVHATGSQPGDGITGAIRIEERHVGLEVIWQTRPRPPLLLVDAKVARYRPGFVALEPELGSIVLRDERALRGRYPPNVVVPEEPS